MRPSSEPGELDPTTAYYEAYAERFVAETVGVDMRPLYGPFLAFIPEGGRILDAGCGSGRDTRAFLEMGYEAAAFDASPSMARAASSLTGKVVPVLRFQQLSLDGEFDGVWACASLLHVRLPEMDDVLERLASALRVGGVLYASFKWGVGTWADRGRRFYDFTEETFGELLDKHPALRILQAWRTADLRPERGGETWLNVLVIRR
jgi:SAM-dependent methyltransferase